MSGILRVYDPADCDEHGVPLDWERCRTCRPSAFPGALGRVPRDPCPTCEGYGSLKAAALAWLTKWTERVHANGVRCDDCGHPMSEGAWEGLPDYSPCDDGCRHGGYALVRDGGSSYMSRESTADDHAAQRRSEPDTPLLASWRPVDVRTLGWPHDLRPEKLAVLCLRCLAARQRA